VALAALSATALLGTEGAEGQGGADPRPNIIVVETDDQTLASFNARTMPYMTSAVAGPGTTFTNSVVTTPLCCPSRATLLTGQYGHNNGIVNNKPGYPALRDKRNVLPTWLHNAGYVTVHLGRYLNEYPKGRKSKPGPGWDEWITMLEPRKYLGYVLRVNRKEVDFGKKVTEYVTRVLNGRTVQMIEKYVPRPQPLYLQLDHMAPHSGAGTSKGPCAGKEVADPDPADYAQYAAEPLPTPPSFNEEDISDKPSFIRKVPPLTEQRIADIAQRYRCALASLASVDRGMAAIDAALARTGELGNTVVIYTSDNGFFYGEHRLPREKIRPYEEALRVPLVIRIPSGVGGPTVPAVSQLVANIDLAPTILELAGAAPCISPQVCRVMDGRSLLGLATGQAGWPNDRGVVIEFQTADQKFGTSSSCAYRGIRTPDQFFVIHTSVPNLITDICEPADEREHYDLADDPFQLQNLYPASPPSPDAAVQARLAERLLLLADCAGIEGRDPVPPSGHYCE
jgi:N-acetylglucosamine-6-sulfatase